MQLRAFAVLSLLVARAPLGSAVGMRRAGMAKMYIPCDGKGAFALDLEVDGCYCSTRVDASF